MKRTELEQVSTNLRRDRYWDRLSLVLNRYEVCHLFSVDPVEISNDFYWKKPAMQEHSIHEKRDFLLQIDTTRFEGAIIRANHP